MATMDDVVIVLKDVLKEVKELNQRLKPYVGGWYGTGVKTISSVVTKGNFNSYDKHDLEELLGHPSMWGTIENHGATATTGYLYIAWYNKSGGVMRQEESRVSPGGQFKWSVDDNYEVYGFRVRTNVANCQYQVEAG